MVGVVEKVNHDTTSSVLESKAVKWPYRHQENYQCNKFASFISPYLSSAAFSMIQTVHRAADFSSCRCAPKVFKCKHPWKEIFINFVPAQRTGSVFQVAQHVASTEYAVVTSSCNALHKIWDTAPSAEVFNNFDWSGEHSHFRNKKYNISRHHQFDLLFKQ